MNKQLILFFLGFFIVTQSLFSGNNKAYLVMLKDKNTTAYTIEDPLKYLSQKALDRRAKHNIAIDMKDLPVSPEYIKAIEDAGNKVILQIKWLNTVVVRGESVQDISELSFVDEVVEIFYNDSNFATKKETKFDRERDLAVPHSKYHFDASEAAEKGNRYDYGEAMRQIDMLNGQYLHNQGYTGKGLTIGVLDAGFNCVDVIPAFDSVINSGRILGTKNIVNDENVYSQEINAHGRMVLACMAANDPGKIVGTAPDASYWLIRTEDAEEEYFLEEYYWIAGAEFADSVGVDIINSSLGYTSGFSDSQFDHRYQDMDGKTTAITRGAGIAASRGIVVVSSAGNSGGDSWYYLCAPSDHDSVICVGAVNGYGNIAYFSSRGPSYDGRVKPDVVAMGQGTTSVNSSGHLINVDGTSFSSPVLAGMIASLWQAFPDKNHHEIIEMVRKYGHMYNNPDNDKGYGIPDFKKIIEELNIAERYTDLDVIAFPNPFTDNVQIFFSGIEAPKSVELLDASGRVILFHPVTFSQDLRLNDVAHLSPGLYFIRVIDCNERVYIAKLIKQ